MCTQKQPSEPVSLPASAGSIFEMVDATDDERYYTLGIWMTLEAALAELDQCDDPSDLGSDGDHDDYAKVEIRQRAIGWSDHGTLVHQREWSQKYDEARDEFLWHVMQGDQGQSPPPPTVEQKGNEGTER